MSPALAPGECVVWWGATSDVDPRHEALLSAGERERLAGYARPADRRRHLLGAALLRLALERCLGEPAARIEIDRRCPRCGRPHGKTRLPGHPGVGLSVAHSGERAVVAIAGGTAIGVDVELVRPGLDVDRLASATLSAAEAARLRTLRGTRRAEAFLELWTRKEALLKARGTGIDATLAAVDPSRAWTCALRADRGYVASLAALRPLRRVSCRTAAALIRAG